MQLIFYEKIRVHITIPFVSLIKFFNIYSDKPRAPKLRQAKKRASHIDKKSILKMQDHFYCIFRPYHPDKSYVINTQAGICTCPVGNTGRFCKHQFAVKEKFGAYCRFTNPCLDAQEKGLFYYIGTGKLCPSATFYGEPTHDHCVPDTPQFDTPVIVSQTPPSSAQFSQPIDIEAVLLGIQNMANDLQEKVKTAPQTYLAKAKKCVDTYNRIKNTPTGLASALAKFGKDEHEFKGFGKIPILDRGRNQQQTKNSGSKISINTKRAGERMYKPPGEASVAQTAGKKPDDFHGPVNENRTLPLGKTPVQKEKKVAIKRKHSLQSASRANVLNGGSHPKGMLNTFSYSMK